MPTAASLVGAICLAALAWLLSELIRPLMPEGTAFGWFNYVNLVIGLMVGWRVLGPRAGRGTVPAINSGVTGVVLLILWGVFIHACYEMFTLAMRNRYDGPMEAITNIFIIASEFGYMIATVPILVTAAVGAVLSGLLVEQASRLWR